MDDQRQPRWRPTGRQILWTVGIGVVLLILIRLGYTYQWTGFGKSRVNEAVQPAKTLWDWLDLLIIPAVLAVGGYLFTRSENKATRVAAEQAAQDEALQAYLEQMGQLLLDQDQLLRARTLARARTLSTLQRLGPEHKRSVLSFLSEARLIDAGDPVNWSTLSRFDIRQAPPIIPLEGANLDYANLKDMFLGWIDLSEVALRYADMTRCRFGFVLAMNAVVRVPRLDDVDLSFAKLREASLPNVHLKGANLRRADLTSAVLSNAKLVRANLTGADLTNATLLGADLTDAIVTEKQLRSCRSLTKATMPNGQKYEDWLNDSEDRKEGGENE